MNRQKERFNFRRPEIMAKTQKPEKQRVRLNFKPLKNIFWLAVMATFLYVMFLSSVFKINDVQIEGVKSVEISDFMKMNLMGRNILLLRTGKFLRSLEKEFPVLSEVSMVRGLPHMVKLSVLERNQTMIWCNSQDCFEIDNQGYAYAKIARPADKIILIDEKNQSIREGDRVASESFIYFYMTMIDQLNNIGVKVTSAKMQETSFKITFITAEGWSIITDSSYSIANQVAAVRQAVEKNKSDIHEYVDVRVEGLAYIK